ncbi:MAG: hypothetical protein ABIG39_02805 [Candidatus Micrarchaeota archaeon]
MRLFLLLFACFIIGCTAHDTSGVERALDECDSIGDLEMWESCRLTAVGLAGSVDACDALGEERALYCYSYIAGEHDPRVCERSSDPLGCYNQAAISSLNESKCDGIEDGENRTRCYFDVITQKGYIDLCEDRGFESVSGVGSVYESCLERVKQNNVFCEQFVNKDTRDYCLGDVSKANVGVCLEIENIEGGCPCYHFALKKNSDLALCEKVPDTEYYKTLCYSYVVMNGGSGIELCDGIGNDTYRTMCRAVGIARGD